jgi:hypothetical protein
MRDTALNEQREMGAGERQVTGLRAQSDTLGLLALGAFAAGALAIGALAIGRMMIGGMAVGKARFRSMEIGELKAKKLHVGELVVMDTLITPNEN